MILFWGVWGVFIGLFVEYGFFDMLIYVVWVFMMILLVLVVFGCVGWCVWCDGCLLVFGFVIGLFGVGG